VSVNRHAGDVGHVVSGTELFGAFHQAIAISGNYHTLVNCTVHDVVQSVVDSGALCE